MVDWCFTDIRLVCQQWRTRWECLGGFLINNNNNAYNWLVVDLPLRKIWKSVGMILPNIWKNKTCSKPPTTTFMSFKGLRSCHCHCGSLFTEDYCFSIPFCRYPTCYAQKQVIPEVCFFGPHRLAPSFFEKPHPRRTWTSLFLSLSLTIINYHCFFPTLTIINYQ